MNYLRPTWKGSKFYVVTDDVGILDMIPARTLADATAQAHTQFGSAVRIERATVEHGERWRNGESRYNR